MQVIAAIFDMDGVIAHTNPYHNEAFKAFFDRHRVRYTDAELAEHMYGKHNSYIMRYFFGRPIEPEEFLALEEEKESLFREIYAEKAAPISGLIPFLDNLQKSGVSLGLATSAPRANMDLIVERLQLQDYFQSKLTGDDVKKHKPEPEVYLRSAEILGLPPQQCVVFEDSSSGIHAGLAAGMQVVGLLTTHQINELPPCAAYLTDYTEVDAEWLKQVLCKSSASRYA